MTENNLKILQYNEKGALRIDVWLALKVGVSRARIQQAITSSLVFVNNKLIKKPSVKLKTNDIVKYSLPPEPLSKAIAENISIKVVYEDNQIIVVDKKAGMVVHPAPGHYSGTLVNALLGRGIFTTKDGDLRPGIVHRIDKDTSGLLVIAKTPKAKEHLTNQFKFHSVKRKYKAVIYGVLPNNEGQFNTFHGRNPGFRLKFSSKVTEGKRAITNYKVIKRYLNMATLVEAVLETGRTHQVRVHFFDSGHPLIGDSLYKKRNIPLPLKSCEKSIGRQALHAALLGFIHPSTQEEMIFESELPDDFKQLLKCLETILK